MSAYQRVRAAPSSGAPNSYGGGSTDGMSRSRVPGIDVLDTVRSYLVRGDSTGMAGANVYVSVLCALIWIATSCAFFATYFTNNTIQHNSFNLFFIENGGWGVNFQQTGEFNVSMTLAVSSLLLGLGYVLDAVLSSTFGNANYSTPRALADSLGVPLISGCLIACFGNFDLFALVSFFALMHCVVVFNYWSESMNQSAPGASYSITAFASWVWLVSLIPVVVYFSFMSGLDKLDAATWAAFGLWLTYWFWLGVLHRSWIASKTGGSFLFGNANSGSYPLIAKITGTLILAAVAWCLWATAFGDTNWIDTSDHMVAYLNVSSATSASNSSNWPLPLPTFSWNSIALETNPSTGMRQCLFSDFCVQPGSSTGLGVNYLYQTCSLPLVAIPN